MAKELLTGTLDEQCEFLYGLAHEKMAQGNFTGAFHALREIVRHNPNYRDVGQLLQEVRARKSEQRFLLVLSLTGAIGGIGFMSLQGVSNDLWLLGGAMVGLLLGYGAANLVNRWRVSR